MRLEPTTPEDRTCGGSRANFCCMLIDSLMTLGDHPQSCSHGRSSDSVRTRTDRPQSAQHRWTTAVAGVPSLSPLAVKPVVTVTVECMHACGLRCVVDIVGEEPACAAGAGASSSGTPSRSMFAVVSLVNTVANSSSSGAAETPSSAARHFPGVHPLGGLHDVCISPFGPPRLPRLPTRVGAVGDGSVFHCCHPDASGSPALDGYFSLTDAAALSAMAASLTEQPRQHLSGQGGPLLNLSTSLPITTDPYSVVRELEAMESVARSRFGNGILQAVPPRINTASGDGGSNSGCASVGTLDVQPGCDLDLLRAFLLAYVARSGILVRSRSLEHYQLASFSGESCSYYQSCSQ